MKTLQEIQQENRKMILEAIHGCSYEEALEKELVVGCKVIDLKHQFFGEHSPTEMVLFEDTGDESFYFTHYRGNPFVKASRQSILDKNRYEILGKPLTLDRVLLAFLEKKICHFHIIIGESSKIELEAIESWDLTKPTLEEQSEETQRAIYELLIKLLILKITEIRKENPPVISELSSEVKQAMVNLKYHSRITDYFDKESALEEIKYSAKNLLNALEKQFGGKNDQ